VYLVSLLANVENICYEKTFRNDKMRKALLRSLFENC
jgi:hypothetical protein